MLSQTPAAIRIREQRSSMTPAEREAYLAKKRERAVRDRADPEKRARSNAQSRAAYQRLRADPLRKAARRIMEKAYYWANQRKRLVQEARLRAVKRGLAFDLSVEWAEITWTGKCAVTGLPFVLGGKRNVFSVSLDRKDNTQGYTQANCRWVLWAVNLLKHTGTDEEMFEIAKAIVRSAA